MRSAEATTGRAGFSERSTGSTLAWLNATGLTDELCVPALRAGVEVLLDSEDAEELARRLGRLLDDTTPIRHRQWTSTITGDTRSANMREVAWWFMEFSVLRNDLMHGRAPGEEKWIRDDRSQIDLGEWYLRQAIEHTVANDWHPDILDDLLWRDAASSSQNLLRGAAGRRELTPGVLWRGEVARFYPDEIMIQSANDFSF